MISYSAKFKTEKFLRKKELNLCLLQSKWIKLLRLWSSEIVKETFKNIMKNYHFLKSSKPTKIITKLVIINLQR